MRKVASADNRSILYRACAKFVTRFASNWFVKSASVSRESKLRKLLANNSPRAFVLFFCSALSGFKYFSRKKFHRILFFLRKYYYATNFNKSCLLSGELKSNWQFFRLIIVVITLMLKKIFSQGKRSYYDLLARVKPS